jgi:hypothetical protein
MEGELGYVWGLQVLGQDRSYSSDLAVYLFRSLQDIHYPNGLGTDLKLGFEG